MSTATLAGAVVTGVAVVLFGALYAVTWAPVVLAGREGWLFLYPLFLVAWVPVEGLALAGLVLAIAGRVRREARRPLGVAVLVVAGLLLVASLPTLWSGPGQPG